jgi:hypothetical protein
MQMSNLPKEQAHPWTINAAGQDKEHDKRRLLPKSSRAGHIPIGARSSSPQIEGASAAHMVSFHILKCRAMSSLLNLRGASGGKPFTLTTILLHAMGPFARQSAIPPDRLNIDDVPSEFRKGFTTVMWHFDLVEARSFRHQIYR